MRRSKDKYFILSYRTYPYEKTDALLPAQKPSLYCSEKFCEYTETGLFRFAQSFSLWIGTTKTQNIIDGAVLVQLGMPAVYKADSPKYSSEVKKLLKDHRSSGSFGAFSSHPMKCRFESQQDDEEILILGRRHFITNLGWIATFSFAFFIPFFWKDFPFIQILDGNTQVTLTMLYYMVLIFFGLQSFLTWFYNVYIVTNERLVDIDFVGLLNKTVNVAQIRNIQDVNYAQKGILASFFDYGDVIVQTASEQKTPDSAGEASAFTFEAVGMPDKVAGMISQLMEDSHKKWN